MDIEARLLQFLRYTQDNNTYILFNDGVDFGALFFIEDASK